MAIQKKSLISNLESTKKSAPVAKNPTAGVSVSDSPVASRAILSKKAAGGVTLSKGIQLSKSTKLSKGISLSKQLSLSKNISLSKKLSKNIAL